MPLIKPTFLYDGDCGFCLKWVKRWERKSHGAVVYEPYQTSLAKFPQVTQEECEQSVCLILPDGRVLSGAHAVLHALVLGSSRSTFLWMYERVPGFAALSEFVYQWIAHHRKSLSRRQEEKCDTKK